MTVVAFIVLFVTIILSNVVLRYLFFKFVTELVVKICDFFESGWGFLLIAIYLRTRD